MKKNGKKLLVTIDEVTNNGGGNTQFFHNPAGFCTVGVLFGIFLTVSFRCGGRAQV